MTFNISVNQGLEQSDTDSFQDSSLKLNVPGGGGQSRSSSLLSESSSQPEVHPFFKDSFGKFIVLYSYLAQDENDLSVERGQLVTLLNKVITYQPRQTSHTTAIKLLERKDKCFIFTSRGTF